MRFVQPLGAAEPDAANIRPGLTINRLTEESTHG